MVDITEFSLVGNTPSKVLTPQDSNELAKMLEDCNHQKLAVTPWGGGTLQHLGNVPSRMDSIIQTSKLNKVVEYEPSDLTVTVQAGITLKQLSDTLGAHSQFLPIDVPLPETCNHRRSSSSGCLWSNASPLWSAARLYTRLEDCNRRRQDYQDWRQGRQECCGV